jgi:hypothetical protein
MGGDRLMTKYASNADKHPQIALGWVGKKYPAGWCLRFCLRELYGVPGIGDWDGDRAADAEDYVKASARADQLHKITDPDQVPAGALVLWTGGRNDHGHSAYSLGRGEIVSTDLPTRGKVGRVSIHRPADSWGLKLVGYVTHAVSGEKLTKGTGSKPEPKATRYRVMARTGLIGRQGPSIRARRVAGMPYGSTIDAVKTVKGGGMDWAVTADGTHYAMRYLRLA